MTASEPESVFAHGECDAILATLHEEYGDELDSDVLDQAVADNLESKRIPRTHEELDEPTRSLWRSHP